MISCWQHVNIHMGGCLMLTHNYGHREGGPWFFVDVINGWPLIQPHCKAQKLGLRDTIFYLQMKNKSDVTCKSTVPERLILNWFRWMPIIWSRLLMIGFRWLYTTSFFTEVLIRVDRFALWCVTASIWRVRGLMLMCCCSMRVKASSCCWWTIMAAEAVGCASVFWCVVHRGGAR